MTRISITQCDILNVDNLKAIFNPMSGKKLINKTNKKFISMSIFLYLIVQYLLVSSNWSVEKINNSGGNKSNTDKF